MWRRNKPGRPTRRTRYKVKYSAFPLHFLIQICNNMPKMRYSKKASEPVIAACPIWTWYLFTAMCEKKRKKGKKITSSCYSRRFLWWKCQLGVWQNDGALRGSFSRTSLGPLLCGGRFLTPVISTVRPATISAALKRAYHLPLSSRRRLSILYPGKYPVALGRNTAGFALVRCPWLVTVWLTHSAMMWGHLRWSARCTLAAKCCNCRAPRSSPPHFVCQRWRSCPPTRCWSASRHSAAL